MTDKWGSLTRKIPTEPEEEELDERDMFDLTAKLKLGEGLGRLTFDGGGLDPDQGEVYSYGHHHHHHHHHNLLLHITCFNLQI